MECSSEEQEMEVEALRSIYGEQFTIMAAREDKQPVSQPVLYEMKLQQSETKIVFTIPEKYPDVPPSISVTQDNQPVYMELESLLFNVARESCGEVMIYNLIEEAKEWIKKLKLAEQMSSSQEEMKSPEDGATICKFFLEGKCRFGSKCFNKHEETTSSKDSVTDGSLYSKMSGEEIEKLSTKAVAENKANGTSKSVKNSGNRRQEREEVEGSKKKPPMKTASDVISRIQWDEELSPKDFIVGYLDRFIGIVEKCFTDLSWEDLASVDHFVDLAIPRHRIQYFKYLGEIVWDKRERIDKVFGSTGSKETILDVKERIGIHGHDSNEVSTCTAVTDDESCIVSELPKPAKEKTGPNYFIAVQISDLGIINSITKIQDTIQVELDQEVEYELTPKQRLHITLLMLTLNSEDHVVTAKSILKSVQPLLVSILPLSHRLRFNGLGQFHNRIVYAKVEPDARLSKLVQALKYKFDKAGISLEGNRDTYVPHVTIMRAGSSRDFSSAGHVQKTLSDLVKANHEIGEQCVESIVLFSRFLPKDIDGTHQKVSTVENSLKSLSSTLPRKLSQHVEYLCESEELSEEERNEDQGLFQSGDAAKLDAGLTRLAELRNPSQDRVVVIMRGIPGSGKTHLVENSVEARDGQSGYAYCSSKQLFHKTGSTSAPDPSELNIAEAYCRSCFLDAMANLCSFIVVDGVHTKCWEYAVYKCLARVFGYTCHVLEIRVTRPEDIKLCHQNCNSGIQLEKMLEDVQDWEEDAAATRIDPWFTKPDAFKYTEPMSLKQLLKAK